MYEISIFIITVLSAWCWLIMYSHPGSRWIIYFQIFDTNPDSALILPFPPTDLSAEPQHLWCMFCHSSPEIITFCMQCVVINMQFVVEHQSLNIGFYHHVSEKALTACIPTAGNQQDAHMWSEWHFWCSGIMPCSVLIPLRSCASLRFIPTTVSSNCLLNEEKSSLIRSSLYLGCEYVCVCVCLCRNRSQICRYGIKVNLNPSKVKWNKNPEMLIERMMLWYYGASFSSVLIILCCRLQFSLAMLYMC